jgi:hypothetical protein
MDIRRDSWHYRFFYLAHGGFPLPKTNLCSYFWRTVWGLLIVLFFSAIAALVLVFLGWAFYFHTLTSFSITGTLVAIVCFLFFWEDVLQPVLQDVLHRKRPEPGLVVAYLKAKKSKVCPIVTIVGKN